MEAAKGKSRATAAGKGAAKGAGDVAGAAKGGDAAAEKRKAPAAPPATNDHVRKSMQGNKRANTKPELLVRQRLRQAGLTGYRLQWKVPGHPDIAWPGKKVCIEVRGCFWHRCPHCQLSMPKSHVEYWALKFDRNVERDAETSAALEAMGWKVHVIWECQLKKKVVDQTFAELLPVLADELGKPLKKVAAEGAAEPCGPSEGAGASPVREASESKERS